MRTGDGPVHRNRDLDTREEITEFVERFSRDLAADDRLRPYFARIDWDAHTSTLVDFWTTTLVGTDDYPGDADSVIESHRTLNAERPFDSELFHRWLGLLNRTLDEGWTGQNANLARRRGHGFAWAMANRLNGINIGTDL